MNIGMRMVQRQVQKQELTLQQRQIIVQSQALSLRLDLIGAINNGERYRPDAQCPACSRVLTPLEIMQGFNTDPNDFTTACSGCGMRFAPKLVWSNAAARIEMPFYCDIQTQNQLKSLAHLSPEELQAKHQPIYHSAIAHHGLVGNAFKAMGMDYPFEEQADVRQRIAPFLGKLPDTVISDVSGISVSKVRRMRKTAGIAPCTYQSMLESHN